MVSITASDVIQYSSDGQSGCSSCMGSWELVKEFTMIYSYTGSWRIVYDLAGDFYHDCSPGSGCDSDIQVFKNGVPYGTKRTSDSWNFITYSEDFTNISINGGDKIQLYVLGSSGIVGMARNFRIKFTVIGALPITTFMIID